MESQIERSTRVITGSGAAWGYSRWRITGGVEGWRDSLAGGGVALRRRCVLSRAASHRRPDQVVPATLEEEDERLKVHTGRWI